jgi:2'-deoxycytidine 5'-triphosphate deaminase (DCD), C-terminal domain
MRPGWLLAKLYGQDIGSNYWAQSLKLSKHFKS